MIDTSDRLADEARRLRSVPGIGPTHADVPITGQPEPRQRGNLKIASLAGLAPMPVTPASLAGFSASRHGPVIKAFRARLEAGGLAVSGCGDTAGRVRDFMHRGLLAGAWTVGVPRFKPIPVRFNRICHVR